MATHLMGPRFHAISFEPWPGGPNTTITWKVPRKCFSLCPPGYGTGTAPASAAAVAAPALEMLATSTGGLAANDTPAATAEVEEDSQKEDLEDTQDEEDEGDEEEEDEEDEEDEDEEMEEAEEEANRELEDKDEKEGGQNRDRGGEGAGGGGGGQSKGQSDENEQGAESGRAVLSPPPESVLVYPTGTAVVVRSVQRKPGRTLKFARGESHEATFEELLGRKVGWSETRSACVRGRVFLTLTYPLGARVQFL